MKHILLITFLLITHTVTAQVYRYYFDESLNPTAEKKAIITGKGSKTSKGILVLFYRISNDRLVGRTLFNDIKLSTRVGINEEYYDDGSIAIINNYTADKLDGLSRRWNETGQLIDSSLYERGKLIISKRIGYFEGRKQEERTENFENNTLEVLHFDRFGLLQTKASFKRQEGTATYYINGRETLTENIFMREEKDASFPGGTKKWDDFLDRHLDSDIIKKQGGYGLRDTVVIEFKIDETGVISDIRPLTKVGFGAEQEVIRVLKKSPDWKPALRYGRPIKTIMKQSVVIRTPLF